MPNTYTLISSNILSTTSSSVTFSSIPATYTDIVLRFSTRSNTGSVQDYPEVYVNGVTSGYSRTALNIGASSAELSSFRNTNRSGMQYYSNAGNSTTSTFTSGEYYFPNYANGSTKVISSYTTQPGNYTSGNNTSTMVQAFLTNSTSAISSLTVVNYNGSFVAGSSFYLYGIKKS
jgi:hypothetical protein